MATTTATVAPNNATDAEFRAWAQFIHDVFANGGWVQTGDTGQINLATATKPGAVNTKVGYEVWRMDDAHQSTNPIVLKLAYGSAAAGANVPAIWFIIGTETDGAGNLIDSADGSRPAYLADFYTQTAAPIQSRTNSATTHICFGSADTDRAVFLAFEAKPSLSVTGLSCDFVNPTNDTAAPGNFSNMFSIERARDANGDTTPDHIIVMWTGTASSFIQGHLYLKTTNDWVIPAPQFGTNSLRPTGVEAIYAQHDDSMLPSAAAAYAIIPFEQNTKPANPGINLLVAPHSIFKFDAFPGNCTLAFTANYISGRTAAVSPYGTARTYRTCAGLRGATFSAGSADTGAFIWMLYE